MLAEKDHGERQFVGKKASANTKAILKSINMYYKNGCLVCCFMIVP